MELQAEPQTRQRAVKALEQHITTAPSIASKLGLKPEELPDYISEQQRLMKILRAKGLRI